MTTAPARSPDPRLRDLSPSSRRLVLLAQDLGFGAIRQLEFRQGEPMFSSATQVVRRVKPGNHTVAITSPPSGDFALRQAWTDLFADLERRQAGIVLNLEIAHGLPLLYDLQESFRI